MLICDELVKKYYSCTAVDHVNMRLDDGKVYAMLGPNGSGKTTLMKMIAGLIKPTSGTITMDGKMLDTKSKAHIAYMPTESYFYPYMTVKDIVAFYKDFYKDFSEPVFYDLLARMGLQFGDKVKNMSTGMLAKLNGIDMLAREVIINAIMANAGGSRTIVISSHLVDELENIVNGALFMKNGQLVLAGDADKLRDANRKSLVELYKEVYGWGGVPYAKAY